MIIAADTQTCVVLGDGSLRARNKPKNKAEIRANFAEMSFSATYEVQAATVFSNNGTRMKDLLHCRVGLRPDTLVEIQTEKGFARYCDVTQRFYAEPPYSTNGFPPMELQDMSGGISLPVLRMMNGIEVINGKRLDELERQELGDVIKEALFTVAVGFSPVLLEKINPRARAIIYNWPWLVETTDKLVAGNHA